MNQRRRLRLSVVLSICILSLCVSAAPANPVIAFIVTADSLANAGGDGELRPYVLEKEALVGAAVWQLLDIAFQVGEDGDKAGEAENVDFAERVAVIHEAQTGSAVPLELVEVYRGWTVADRSIRAKAKALHDESDALRTSEPERAVEMYEKAMALYGEIDDRHSVAVVLGGFGVAYWYLGDMDAVKGHYERALAERRAVEDHILEGKTLNGLGSVHLRAGEFAEAGAYYEQAIEVRRRTGDIAGLGTSLTYLGHVYYQTKRLVDARDQYQIALPLLEAQGNADAMVDLLNGIANCYSDMGRFERAGETYRRAIAASRVAGDVSKEIQFRMNLSVDYRKTGRYADAFAELDTTAAILDQHNDPFMEAVFYKNRGITYMDAGQLDRAREDVLECVRLADGLDDPEFYIESLVNVGYLYKLLGAYDRGLDVAGRAKAMAEENGLPRPYREAMALTGELQRFAGDYDAALEAWGEVLAQDENDGMTSYVLTDRITIAGIHAVRGDTETARGELYDIAPDIRDSGSELLEMGRIFALGHTFENENPDSTAHYYEAGLAMIEASRASLGADESRSGFLSGERRFYFEEVARYYASVEGGDWADRAFMTVERAKARGLLDLIALNEAARTSEAEEELLDEIYRLDTDTDDYETRRTALESKYEEAREERLEASMGALIAAGAAGIGDVQKTLPKKSVMLQYALGDTTSLLWVIDRKGFDLVTLPNRSELRPAVDRLRDAMGQPGAGDVALRSASRELYRMLIEPAAPRLEKAEHLVIVPDGFLHELPFDALVSPEGGDEGWSTQPYLARKFSTVYAPSAAIYLELRAAKKPKYEYDLVAYGDPDYSLLVVADGGTALAALPYARAEVAAISAGVKDKKKIVRLGADANEAALKAQMAGGSARVLHLATHGLVNPVEPSASSVVLCPDPAGTEDGYLETLEILSLQSGAGIVVVSACESALGRVSRGEGVVGLSRAFIASGAGSVVASLWAVSDESTSKLMQEFYAKMLGKKRPAGSAMRDARLALIENEEFSHPFYWSPFIVIGSDTSPW